MCACKTKIDSKLTTCPLCVCVCLLSDVRASLEFTFTMVCNVRSFAYVSAGERSGDQDGRGAHRGVIFMYDVENKDIYCGQ